MNDFETRDIFQLPPATAVAPGARVPIQQQEDGPLQGLEIERLFAHVIATDAARDTVANLQLVVAEDANEIGLVFSDPDPELSGWYRSTAAGAGNWVQFEKLSGYAAVVVAELVEQAGGHANVAANAAASVQALTNYRAALTEAVADFSIGEWFASAESGALRVYQRIVDAPGYLDGGDVLAPLTKAFVRSPSGSLMLGFQGYGDGAQLRSAASRFSERISVMDYMTEAEIADVQSFTGSLDVTAAINAAIEYARTSGKREVFFPPGKYRVTDVIRPTAELFGVTLRGSGVFATVIYVDHNLGPGVRLNRSLGIVTHMTIEASPARRAGSAGTGSNLCVGMMFEPSDEAGKACAMMAPALVRVIYHPHSGVLAVSHNQMSVYDHILSQANGKHAFQFDEGQVTGRVNRVYSGLITLSNCWGLENGGHGLVFGNPNDTSQVPIRLKLDNCEFADNCLDPAECYSNEEVWTRGENVLFELCAFGRQSATPIGAVRFSGRVLRLNQCRFVRTSNMVNLEDDPVYTGGTRSVVIDQPLVISNAHNPSVIHSGTQSKLGVIINSVGELSNITKAFQDGLPGAIWNKHFPLSVVRKKAAQSVTSSAALVDDTELQCTLRIAWTYLFEAHIRFSGASAGDIKVAFVGPAVAGGLTATVVRWDNVGGIYVASGDTLEISSAEITEAGSRAFGASGAGTVRTISVRGLITTGTNPGKFKMRFAQNTPDETPTTVQAGSYLKLLEENAGNI